MSERINLEKENYIFGPDGRINEFLSEEVKEDIELSDKAKKAAKKLQENIVTSASNFIIKPTGSQSEKNEKRPFWFSWENLLIKVLGKRVESLDEVSDLVRSAILKNPKINFVLACDGVFDVKNMVTDENFLISSRSWAGLYDPESGGIIDIVVFKENKEGSDYLIVEQVNDLIKKGYFNNKNLIPIINIDHHHNRSVPSSAGQVDVLASTEILGDLKKRNGRITTFFPAEPLGFIDADVVGCAEVWNWHVNQANNPDALNLEQQNRASMVAKIISVFDKFSGNPPSRLPIFDLDQYNAIFGEVLANEIKIVLNKYIVTHNENELDEKKAVLRFFALIYKVCGNWDIIKNQLRYREPLFNEDQATNLQAELLTKVLTKSNSLFELLIEKGLDSFFYEIEQELLAKNEAYLIDNGNTEVTKLILDIHKNPYFLVEGASQVVTVEKELQVGKKAFKVKFLIVPQDQIEPDTIALWYGDPLSFIKITPTSISVFLAKDYRENMTDLDPEDMNLLKNEALTHLVLQAFKAVLSRFLPALHGQAPTYVLQPPFATYSGSRTSGYSLEFDKMVKLANYFTVEILKYFEEKQNMSGPNEFTNLENILGLFLDTTTDIDAAVILNIADQCAVSILSEMTPSQISRLITSCLPE